MSEPGPEVMARFVGAENVERGRNYLEQLDPELHRYIIDFVYGEVYAGEILDPKTRALCTVAMLATLGQQLQLGVYVQAARRRGAHRAGDPRGAAPGRRVRRVPERLERPGNDEGRAGALRGDRPGESAVSWLHTELSVDPTAYGA